MTRNGCETTSKAKAVLTMPYDIVGNAAGRSTSQNHQHHNRNQFGRNHIRNQQRRFGGRSSRCRAWDCARSMFFVFFVGGGACLFFGVSHLMSAMTDSRGHLLQQWNDVVTDWTTTGQALFMDSKPTVTTGTNPTTTSLVDVAVSLKPSSFGEDSWSTKKIDTPSTVTDHTWSGTAQCPGHAPNIPCTINIKSATSHTIATRTITPLVQTGPTQHVVGSNMCQWYDSDYYHPMASVGMGTCNNAMVSSQTYNYGPDTCVVDHYLDKNGCPNDLIVTSQWVKVWPWARNPTVIQQLNAKPRFTYDSSNGGKCWDYSDCFCSGCGYEFKTDQSKGWGFTGYGYFYNNRWTSFPKPFAQMSGTERAQQCKQQFDNMGFHCPASRINLICFRAGGYPKQKCSNWCHAQDPKTAVYSPPQSYVTMTSYYGPWGRHGVYPKYTSTEAKCTFEKTSTTTIVGLDIALDAKSSSALSTGSKWLSGTTFVEQSKTTGHVPFTNIAATVPVKINVRSSVGPVMEGIQLTKGCGPSPPVTSTPSRCFGPTQSENFTTGLILTLVGSLLFCGPIVCAFMITKGIVNGFNGNSSRNSSRNTAQQQPYHNLVQPLAQPPPAQHIPVAQPHSTIASAPQQPGVVYMPPGAQIPVAQPIA